MPNFNHVEKSEILRLISSQDFDELLRQIKLNFEQSNDWGLIIAGKITYIAKKIVQEGFSQSFKLQLAIRNLRFQSDFQDPFHLQLSLLQSLIKVIEIKSRHVRDIAKLSTPPKNQKLSTLAPSFTPNLTNQPQPALQPQIYSIHNRATSSELDLSNQHQEYPPELPSPSSEPISHSIHLPPETNDAPNSDWEDYDSEEGKPHSSNDSYYEGGEQESEQNFTHIDQIFRKNNQENLINVTDSLINKINQQDPNQKLLQQQTQQIPNMSQLLQQNQKEDKPKTHDEKYNTIVESLLNLNNYQIPFDTYEQYNDLKEKIVSLRINSALSSLHNSIANILEAVKYTFDLGDIYKVLGENVIYTNSMKTTQLSYSEFFAFRAIIGILIKFQTSDFDSILRIEIQNDSMFNRNTILFKVLGKSAFSLQKDLNKELATKFKKHLLTKLINFSTKVINLNQNLFVKQTPNQPNLVTINPKQPRRHSKRNHRQRGQRKQKRFQKPKRHRRRN